MTTPDHYAVLGVAPDATPDEIRRAWRFAIEAFHPDRYAASDQRDRAHDMATRVNAAWDVLGDATRRATYDVRRRDGAGAGHEPPMREVPCPSCLVRCGVPDQGGRAINVRCPGCGMSFRAHVGATLVGRPQLVWKGFSGRHVLVLLDRQGALSEVVARRLPAELALSEGEVVTVVRGGRRGDARYVIVHGHTTDIGWKVG